MFFLYFILFCALYRSVKKEKEQKVIREEQLSAADFFYENALFSGRSGCIFMVK